MISKFIGALYKLKVTTIGMILIMLIRKNI